MVHPRVKIFGFGDPHNVEVGENSIMSACGVSVNDNQHPLANSCNEPGLGSAHLCQLSSDDTAACQSEASLVLVIDFHRSHPTHLWSPRIPEHSILLSHRLKQFHPQLQLIATPAVNWNIDIYEAVSMSYL